MRFGERKRDSRSFLPSLKTYRYPDDWEGIRKAVFERDGYVCQKCGKKFGASKLNAHHVLPLSRGGSSSLKNLVTLCLECHKLYHGK